MRDRGGIALSFFICHPIGLKKVVSNAVADKLSSFYQFESPVLAAAILLHFPIGRLVPDREMFWHQLWPANFVDRVPATGNG